MRIQYWDTQVFHNAVSMYFDVSGRKSRGLCPLRQPSVVGCPESGSRTVNGYATRVLARRLVYWVSQFSVVPWVSETLPSFRCPPVLGHPWIARPFWDTHGLRIQYWDAQRFHNAVSTYFDVSGRKSRGLCPLRPPSVVGCSESGARTVNGDGALVVARWLCHWVSQFSVVGGGFRWVSKFRFFVSDGAPISRANYLDLFESSAAEK